MRAYACMCGVLVAMCTMRLCDGFSVHNILEQLSLSALTLCFDTMWTVLNAARVCSHRRARKCLAERNTSQPTCPSHAILPHTHTHKFGTCSSPCSVDTVYRLFRHTRTHTHQNGTKTKRTQQTHSQPHAANTFNARAPSNRLQKSFNIQSHHVCTLCVSMWTGFWSPCALLCCEHIRT